MKSLHTRLDCQKDAVLSVTAKLGRFKAMNDFGVRDYPGFVQWLKEVTGDENFGLRPKISLNGHRTLGDQLVDAMLRAVADLKTDRDEWKQRAELLEWQLSQSSQKEESQALAVLEVCEV